jgi:hypothetical protein
MNIYASGDDITINFTLTKNGAALVSPGLVGAVVSCAMLLSDRSAYAAGTGDVAATILDEALCTCQVTFPRATTSTIVPGRYLVEAQVTQGGQVRTYIGAHIEVVNGAKPA